MRFPLGFAAVALLVTGSGCGGSGGYGGNPGAPSPPTTGSGAPVISIVGDRGAQSFSPNPGSGSQDQTITWRNNDSVVHRIVANDGSFDSGDIPAGGNSRVIQIPASGTNYHCSIHPGMIGAVSASSGAPPPPCTGTYC
jgi:plastocyanin